jgi:two-component system, NtrC family, sensor kinase
MPLRQLLKDYSGELQTEMQLVLNALVEGICGVGAQGNATFCNQVFLEMTGYSTEEVIGKNAHALMHHETDGTRRREEDCSLRKALDSRQHLHIDCELIWRKDGTSLPVEYWVHPLQKPSSETVCLVTVHDISDRELATAALRISEERFQQISNNIDQAFYLVDVIGSRLVYASPAFETITGHSCQEAYEKPSPWRDLAVPEHREKVIGDYNRLVGGEETKSEYQIRHSDGTTRWVKDHAKPIRDGTRRVCMFAGVAEDITAIHQAREVLRQSEERFRRILASVAEVAWTSDQKRRTIYISPKVESVLGYTKEEICSAGAVFRSGLIHPEDFGRVNRNYIALFEGQSAFDEEYRIRRKDGSWIWIHDRAMGVHQEEGVLYADGVFSDITRRKQAEAELQWKTAFLEAQANSTIDGILVVAGNNKRLLHNQKFVELFHVPAELASNKDDGPMLRHVTWLARDPESFLERINYLYQHPGETSRDEIELKDGTVVDRYSAPVIDKEGKYYGRIWTFRDITERKRNEETLQKLSLAVEQSPASVMITNARGDISYVNQRFTDVTGYKAEEVLGRNPRLLNAQVSPPEHFRNLWSTITGGDEWKGELCNRKKSGEIYWEAATIRPITDAQGTVTSYLALKEDITERRRAERELWLTKASLENASAGVFWIDPQGRIVYANQTACRSLEYSREDLVSLSIADIDPVSPQEAFTKLWEQCKTRGSVTIESQHKSRLGRIFPVEITASYIEFDGQEYSFAFVRDITERRELEAQLRQAHKLEGIGQLSAGIAHEINTPTQFVTDNLTFLRDSWKATCKLLELYRNAIRDAAGALSSAAVAAVNEAEHDLDLDFIVTEVPHAIEQSLDGAYRVAKIVRAMKEFSHPDSAEKTNTDLNRAAESTITVARNEWKYVAEVETEFDKTLPAVLCYPGDVNQVILNVLVNAAHAIKEKGNDAAKGLITIRTRRRGEFAEISVTDTGTGIREAIRTRIFDPFFTTKEVGKGTGQGLSLAHSLIVKKHGGKIWFETEMGRGTTFFIDLPIKPV